MYEKVGVSSVGFITENKPSVDVYLHWPEKHSSLSLGANFQHLDAVRAHFGIKTPFEKLSDILIDGGYEFPDGSNDNVMYNNINLNDFYAEESVVKEVYSSMLFQSPLHHQMKVDLGANWNSDKFVAFNFSVDGKAEHEQIDIDFLSSLESSFHGHEKYGARVFLLSDMEEEFKALVEFNIPDTKVNFCSQFVRYSFHEMISW